MAELGEEERIALLIELIQNYELLYDLSSKDYKNILKKEQAWGEISEISNISVEECKRHWKNLRDRSTREKRGKPSGSGGDESSSIRFPKMLFYNKYTKPRKTHTTTTAPKPSAAAASQARPDSRTSSSCSSHVSIWSSMHTIVSQEAEETEEPTEDSISEASATQPVDMEYDGDVDVDVSEPLGASGQAETPRVSKATSSSGRGKRKAGFDDDLIEVLNVAKRIATKIEEPKIVKLDVNRTFADYVYSRLSEMSPEESKKLRKAMLQILEWDD